MHLIHLTSAFTFAGTLRATDGGQEILRQALVGSGSAIATLFLDEPGRGFGDESNAIAALARRTRRRSLWRSVRASERCAKKKARCLSTTGFGK